MKTYASNASIKKFIDYANNAQSYDSNELLTKIANLGNKLLEMEKYFDDFNDGKELFRKIILDNAPIHKKGKNSHITLDKMNITTFTTYFRKHLLTKIKLLNRNPINLVTDANALFEDHVCKIVNMLQNIIKYIPSFTNEKGNNISYNFTYDKINNCLYQITDNGIYTVHPDMLYELANKQKHFFENINK
jgi:hypothetical protein